MFMRLASKASAVQPASKSAFAASSSKVADTPKSQAAQVPQPVRPPPPPAAVKNLRDMDATLDGPPATTLGALFGQLHAAQLSGAAPALRAPPVPPAPAPAPAPPVAHAKKQCRFNAVVDEHIFGETWESTLPELPPLPSLPVVPSMPPPPTGPTLLQAMVALIPDMGKEREVFEFLVGDSVTQMTPAVQTEVLAALLTASKISGFSKQQALNIVDDYRGSFVGPCISYSRS